MSKMAFGQRQVTLANAVNPCLGGTERNSRRAL